MTNDSTRQDGFCVEFPSFQLKPGFLDLTNNADGEMVFNKHSTTVRGCQVSSDFPGADYILLLVSLLNALHGTSNCRSSLNARPPVGSAGYSADVWIAIGLQVCVYPDRCS